LKVVWASACSPDEMDWVTECDSEGEAVGSYQETDFTSAEAFKASSPSPERWYAVQTRARHEQRISAGLRQRGVSALSPTTAQAHRWSDRTKIVEVPLFSCYVFVHLSISSAQRLEVLKTPGVFRFVTVSGAPAEIPDSQVIGIQTVLANNLPVSPCGFIHIGQKVRIRGGALDGVEGILQSHGGGQKLVISVDLIQRSIELTVEGYSVEPVKSAGLSSKTS